MFYYIRLEKDIGEFSFLILLVLVAPEMLMLFRIDISNFTPILKCLITYKEEYSEHVNDELTACFSAIEHWQILSLKDIRFSFNFKQGCR